jgi:hypothetical protein
MPFKKTAGIEGSIFGKALSGRIVKSLHERFPAEPLKMLGKFMKTELEARIAISKSDEEVASWEEARKDFSPILVMSIDDVLDGKDLKATKAYLKKRSEERKAIAGVYKNLRERIFIL